MKVRLRNCKKEANAWAVNEPLVKTLGIRTEIHGGYPTMNAGTRRVTMNTANGRKIRICLIRVTLDTFFDSAPSYSCLSATIGSTRVARRAGT